MATKLCRQYLGYLVKNLDFASNRQNFEIIYEVLKFVHSQFSHVTNSDNSDSLSDIVRKTPYFCDLCNP